MSGHGEDQGGLRRRRKSNGSFDAEGWHERLYDQDGLNFWAVLCSFLSILPFHVSMSTAASTTVEETNRLLYRRQFLLAPGQIDFPFSSWTELTVGHHGQTLYLHPDLGFEQVRVGEREATVLGYIVDPDRLGAPEEELLRGLLNREGTLDALLEAVERWSGRWILLLGDGADTVLFHDAVGARQVHYYQGANGCWAVTQPHLLEEVLPLERDPEATAYRESRLAYDHHSVREYTWPGDSSEFVGVRRLLPNHYLNLRLGTVTRFWPRDPIKPAAMEEVAADLADLLRRLFRAAHARFDLAVTMTAGRDSRLMLAGSREMADEVYYHTAAYWGLNDRDPDIWVPRRLLRQLGLTHHVISCPETMSPEFRNLYEQNVAGAHPDWGIIAEGLQADYPLDRLCVKGNCVEISRPLGGNRATVDEMNPESSLEEVMQRVYLDPNHPFVQRHMSRWFEGAAPACRETGLHPAELVYWEQRMGSWQAMSQAEWDLVQDVFMPFNCRYMHAQLYRLPMAERSEPEARVHTRILELLWPEVLRAPINPVSLSKRVREFVSHRVRSRLRNTWVGEGVRCFRDWRREG